MAFNFCKNNPSKVLLAAGSMLLAGGLIYKLTAKSMQPVEVNTREIFHGFFNQFFAASSAESN